MSMLLEKNCDPELLSPLTLAFIGDGVYDLLVRQYLVALGSRRVGELNAAKVKLVNCKSQAEMMNKILPNLTEEETAVYKRGRNASPKTTPKNASVADYHTATGLEALFGFLYLSDRSNRLEQLFKMLIE